MKKIDTIQVVRLIDVLFIGPYLIQASSKVENKNDQTILFLIGFSTIIFNGYNFIKQYRNV